MNLKKSNNYWNEDEAKIKYENKDSFYFYPLFKKIAYGINAKRRWNHDEDYVDLVVHRVFEEVLLPYKKYDPTKGTLYSFFTKTIQNYFFYEYKRIQNLNEVSLSSFNQVEDYEDYD